MPLLIKPERSKTLSLGHLAISVESWLEELGFSESEEDVSEEEDNREDEFSEISVKSSPSTYVPLEHD
jgi:hypothetical protein